MYKLKYISLFIFLVFASGLYAQSDSASQGGEIVMTKDELKSFLKSVAEAKLKRMQAQREMQDKLGLAEAKAYYYEQLSQQQRQPYGYYHPQGYYNQAPQQQDSRSLLFEIERLNNKVDYLLKKVAANESSAPDEIVIVPGSNSVAPVTNDQSHQVAELQRKLDSLQKKESVASSNNNQVVSDLDALNQRFDELNNRLQNASKEERRSALEELLRKYGNFKKQVFFANNSSKVSTSDMEYIDDVVQVLKKNPELSIVLEGYASPVGNANYNKRLSMRRAEAVQAVLQNKGISSARIVSAFKGEDHSGSEAHARRVDMSIIIK